MDYLSNRQYINALSLEFLGTAHLQYKCSGSCVKLRPSTSDLLALPSIANLVNFAIDIPLREAESFNRNRTTLVRTPLVGQAHSAKLDLQEKTRAMGEQRAQIDAAEQDLQKREKVLRNAEKAFGTQREDRETAIKR